jgi:hypothetical protein
MFGFGQITTESLGEGDFSESFRALEESAAQVLFTENLNTANLIQEVM